MFVLERKYNTLEDYIELVQAFRNLDSQGQFDTFNDQFYKLEDGKITEQDICDVLGVIDNFATYTTDDFNLWFDRDADIFNSPQQSSFGMYGLTPFLNLYTLLLRKYHLNLEELARAKTF